MWGPWWTLATLGGGTASYPGVELTVSERRLSAGLSGGYRWLRWPIVPHVGASLELTGVEQALRRSREEELQRTFGVGPLPPRRALGLGAGAVAGVEIPLRGDAFALAQGQLLVSSIPSAAAEGSSVRPAATAWAGLGWRL